MKIIYLIAVCLALVVDLSPGESSPAATKSAIFAGGCFWCIQPAFDKAPGVIRTTVGYCGGTEPNPTYSLVGSEKTKYRESIEIVYDSAKISYEQLLDIYWKQIDPTQSDGQFTDRKISSIREIQETDRDRNFAGTEILAGGRLSSKILPAEPGTFRSLRARVRARFVSEEKLGRETLDFSI